MRLAQEELLLAADRAGRIKATVLRLPDFYGPGVDKSFCTRPSLRRRRVEPPI